MNFQKAKEPTDLYKGKIGVSKNSSGGISSSMKQMVFYLMINSPSFVRYVVVFLTFVIIYFRDASQQNSTKNGSIFQCVVVLKVWNGFSSILSNWTGVFHFLSHLKDNSTIRSISLTLSILCFVLCLRLPNILSTFRIKVLIFILCDFSFIEKSCRLSWWEKFARSHGSIEVWDLTHLGVLEHWVCLANVIHFAITIVINISPKLGYLLVVK